MNYVCKKCVEESKFSHRAWEYCMTFLAGVGFAALLVLIVVFGIDRITP